MGCWDSAVRTQSHFYCPGFLERIVLMPSFDFLDLMGVIATAAPEDYHEKTNRGARDQVELPKTERPEIDDDLRKTGLLENTWIKTAVRLH